jgi:hypothetical protein
VNDLGEADFSAMRRSRDKADIVTLCDGCAVVRGLLLEYETTLRR